MPGPWTPEHRAAYEARIAERKRARAAGEPYERPTPSVKRQTRSPASDIRLTASEGSQEPRRRRFAPAATNLSTGKASAIVEALSPDLVRIEVEVGHQDLAPLITGLVEVIPKVDLDGHVILNPGLAKLVDAALDAIGGMRGTVLRIEDRLKLALPAPEVAAARHLAESRPVQAEDDGQVVRALLGLARRIEALEAQVSMVTCEHHVAILEQLGRIESSIDDRRVAYATDGVDTDRVIRRRTRRRTEAEVFTQEGSSR